MIVGIPILRLFEAGLARPEPIGQDDGLGQSSVTDLKWIKRFKEVSRRNIAWRTPIASDIARFEAFQELQKFGDFLVAAADTAAQHLFVVERIWNGWPDPPRFAFFAISGDHTIWAAADFHRWPRRWAKGEIEI